MNQYNCLPIIYHPTNVMLLDDNRAALNNVSGKIDTIFPYVLKQNPKEALYYLETHAYEISSLSKDFSQQDYETIGEGERIRYNFSALHAKLNSPRPYKIIVTTLVDYMMEGMSGLEFAKEARDLELPVQIILLTGKAGLDKAVKAFNEGLIDAYIHKDDSNLHKKVNETLKQLSWKQFQLISQALLGSFLSQSPVLSDVHFREVFNRIRNDYNACSFCLADMSGSYLLIDPSGNTKYLMVRTHSDFDTIYDLAKDSHAPHDVLQTLRDKQGFPFTRFNNLYPMLKGDAWAEAMVHLDKIPGREIFYSVVDIGSLDVFPFKRYVNEIWPQP